MSSPTVQAADVTFQICNTCHTSESKVSAAAEEGKPKGKGFARLHAQSAEIPSISALLSHTGAILLQYQSRR